MKKTRFGSFSFGSPPRTRTVVGQADYYIGQSYVEISAGFFNPAVTYFGGRNFGHYMTSTRFPFHYDVRHQNEIRENGFESCPEALLPARQEFSLTARNWWFRRRNITNFSNPARELCSLPELTPATKKPPERFFVVGS